MRQGSTTHTSRDLHFSRFTQKNDSDEHSDAYEAKKKEHGGYSDRVDRGWEGCVDGL